MAAVTPAQRSRDDDDDTRSALRLPATHAASQVNVNNNNNNNVVCPLAESYIGDSATNAGSAAEAAATRKAAKYAGLERTHIFQPVAVENLGTMNASAYGVLAGPGQEISPISGDDRETCYLFHSEFPF